MTNKEKLYKKVSALFPSELGVGDVVTRGKSRKYYVILTSSNAIEMLKCSKPFFLIIDGKNHYEWVLDEKDLKLIRKAITLSMVLEAMDRKVEYPYYCVFYVHSGALVKHISEAYCKSNNTDYRHHQQKAMWQLRKDGKDCNLYDQSIELIKLVYEVLK